MGGQLGSPCGHVMVTAVESADAAVTRRQLDELATRGATIHVAGVTVVSVPDAAHYRDRAPGPVAMPSTGEVW